MNESGKKKGRMVNLPLQFSHGSRARGQLVVPMMMTHPSHRLDPTCFSSDAAALQRLSFPTHRMGSFIPEKILSQVCPHLETSFKDKGYTL
ncbi:hypothetical protein TNCT_735541 [Trichonephila clavata]|uniref:Uncharacterized protein n=1 Tax=Trichonephila clavata TaxID=2740835 RepID=A0A8X6FQ06_TRICU|nr:hypothetical protein TNCT_735541 [Trichonephila clavata]